MREIQLMCRRKVGLISALVITLCLAPTVAGSEASRGRSLQVTIRAFQCNKDGFFRDPFNCTVFYRCADLTGHGVRFQLFRFDCPPGTVFDPAASVCDHPQLVDAACADWSSDDVNRQAVKPIVAATAITQKPLPVPGSIPLSITTNVAELPGTDIPIFSKDVPTSVANQRCRTAGLFRNPDDCRMFHICVDVYGNGTMFQLCEYPCPLGTVFSNLLAICTEPANAEPCIGSGIATTPAGPGPVGTRPTTPPTSRTTVPTTPRPTGPPDTFRCAASGYFRHPSDCTRYYQCVNLTADGRVFQRYEFVCGLGSVFDESIKVCNHPGNVPGCSGATLPPPTPGGSTSRPSTSDPKTSTSLPISTPSGPHVGTSTKSPVQTLPPVIAGSECRRNGLFPNPRNCSRFYQCVNLTIANDRFRRYEFTCGPGTVFDPTIGVCNHAAYVPHCGVATVAPITSATRPGISESTTTPLPWVTASSHPPTPSIGFEITHTSTETIPVTSTTAVPAVTFPTPVIAGSECSAPGLFRHPSDCARFFRCVNLTLNHDRFVRYDFICGVGSVFDQSIGVCNHPSAVPGCEGYVAPTVSPTPSPGPTPPSTSTPGTLPTTASPLPPISTLPPPVIAGSECSVPGLFRHPTDCARFFRCVNLTVNHDRFIRYDFICGLGSVFDQSVGVCNHPSAVPGCEGYVAPTVIPTPSPGPTPPSTLSPGPTTASPLPPISTLPPPVIAGSECSVSGLFRHPTDCARFFRCVNLTINNDRFIRYDFSCGLGSVFDQSVGVCNHPSAVPGCEGYVAPAPVPAPGPGPTQSSTVSPGPLPTTASPLPPVSTLPPPVIAGSECSVPGLFRHPSDCTRFFRCVNLTLNHDRFIRYDFICGVGSVFDQSIGVCNHPSAVPGCEGYVAPTVIPTPGTSTPGPLPVTASPFPPITTLPPPVIAGSECSVPGLFRHPSDCARFYRCVNLTLNHDRFIRYDFICGTGSVFDQSIGVCNHPSAVPGCEGYVAPTVIPTPSPGSTPPSTLSPGPTTPSPLPPISTLPPPVIAGSECSVPGLFRHPSDCARFFRCVNLTLNHDRFIRYDFICGLGSVFDQSIGVCNHPSAVPGCEGYVAPTPIPAPGPGPTQPSTLSPGPTTASPLPPISTLPPPVIAGSECSVPGLFRHPSDCARFFRCVNLTLNHDRFIRYDFVCGLGSVFDQSIGVCNHQSAVPGCEGYVAPTVIPTPSPGPTPPSTLSPGPTTASPLPPISTLPPPVIAGSECSVSGLFRHPTDCARFFRCVNLTVNNDRFIRYDFICGLGSVFDQSIGVCNHPSAVPGCEGYIATTVIPTPSPGPIPPSTLSPGPTAASPLPPISTLPPPVIAGSECSTPGLFRHPSDCARFFRCVNLTLNHDRFIRYDFVCGLGSVFDQSVGVCNHPSSVPGCEGYVAPTVIPTPSPGPTPPSTLSPGPTTPSPLPPISTLPPPVIAGSECSVPGLFRHPSDCARFYRCVNLTVNNDRFIRYDFICGVGSVFDQSIGVCNHPSAVPGCEGYVAPTVIPTSSPGPSPPSTLSPVTTPSTITDSFTPPTAFGFVSTSTVVVPAPTSSSPLPPVIAGAECSKAGIFRHPLNCEFFYRCVNTSAAHDKFVRYDFRCGPGTVFDESVMVCNHPSAVPGCEGHTSRPWPSVSPTTPSSHLTDRPTPEPTVTLPTFPTRPSVHPSPPCSAVGYFRHPSDCSRFYRCVNLTLDHTVFQKTSFVCADGTVFDPVISNCNHPSHVPGCENFVHPTRLPPGGGSVTEPGVVVTLPGSGSTLPPKFTPSPPPVGPPRPTWPACHANGFFRHPSNCSLFYRCINITSDGRTFQRFEFNCGHNTVFDPSLSVCNHPASVPGCEGHPIVSPATPAPSQTIATVGPTAHPVTSGNVIETSTVTVTVSPTTPVGIVPITTAPGSGSGSCFSDGFFRHFNDCARFFRCVQNNQTKAFVKYEFACGSGSVFDLAIMVCNHPSAVPGCEGYIPPPTPPCPKEPSTTTPAPVPTVAPITASTTLPPLTPPTSHGIQGTSQIITEVTVSSAPWPTTPPPLPQPIPSCNAEGLFKHPQNCSKFVRCVDLTGKGQRFQKFIFNCPPGTFFDSAISSCNHQHLVACGSGSQVTTPSSVGSSTPGSIGSSTPGGIGSSTPSSIGSSTPSSIGSSTLGGIGTSTPSSIGSSTSSSIGSSTSSSIGSSTSSSIGSSTPSSIGTSTPSIISTSTPSIISTSTVASTSTTHSGFGSTSLTTIWPGLTFQCTRNGKFEHRFNCARFYLCQDLLGDGKRFHLCEVVCPEGTYFDKRYEYCSEDVTLASACIDKNQRK